VAHDRRLVTLGAYEGHRVELLASGTNYYRGYDPLTGRELLKSGIDGRTTISSRPLIASSRNSTDKRRRNALSAARRGLVARPWDGGQGSACARHQRDADLTSSGAIPRRECAA
jgi:hypothetical protein